MVVLCASQGLAQPSSPQPSTLAITATAPVPREDRTSLPLAFEENLGQHPSHVRYVSRGSGYDVALLDDRVIVSLRGAGRAGRLALRFEGAADLRPTAVAALPGKVNYLVGSDRTRWRTNVPTYARVQYDDVYPGIDAVFYGNGRQLEYDLVIAPGADPSAARATFDGVDALRVNDKGDLELTLGGETVRYTRPLAFQEIDGARHAVEAEYSLEGRTVSFRVGAYDPARPLTIDPVLVYSTYLGGSEGDEAYGVATDAAGNVYVTGHTRSHDFTTTPSAYQTALPWEFSTAAFVTKINRAGTAVIYSTYLGGEVSPSGTGAFGRDIAVDALGHAYVIGATSSSAFPTTAGAHQRTHRGGVESMYDVFVVKLAPTGDRLVYSTLLGGSGDEASFGVGVAVDPLGNAYAVGDTNSTDFPVTPGALRTTNAHGRTGFAVKLNGVGAATYATYLTGSGQSAMGVAIDEAGHAYVTGLVVTGLAVTPGALQSAPAGNWDVYVAKLNPAGSAFVYATYLGTTESEVGTGIAVDPYGRAYVTGWTSARDTFPISRDAFQRVNAGPAGTQDAFVTVLLEHGDRIWYSTLIGGSADDRATAIDLDSWMRPTIVGWTQSTNYPVHEALQPVLAGLFDGFVTTVVRGGYALEYSSYLGGRYGDMAEDVVVATAARTTVVGKTASDNFPLHDPLETYQTCGNSLCYEGFVTQMAPAAPRSVSAGDVVLYAADATIVSGGWRRADDTTAAGGVRLQHPDAGAPKLDAALATPAHYFEVAARVEPDLPYTVWIRGRADNEHWANDSVFVQFSNAIQGDNPDEEPYPNYVYQIGTSNALTVVLEDCRHCGLRGWTWADSGYGFKVAGPSVTFSDTNVTIRIQTREDGVSIDQIVLAPFNGSPYAAQAPGFQKDDDTILPRQHGAGGAPPPTPGPLPEGWQGRDIGAVGAAGSSSFDSASGTFTVTGSGADIWSTADEFHYAYTTVTGEFEVVTRVTSVEHVHAWTKAGIMIREHEGAGARHASIFVTPTNVKGIAFQRRSVENGPTGGRGASGGNFHPPIWIRLVSQGHTFFAYYRWSPDEPWVGFGQHRFESVAPTLLVGLAVSSHVDGTLATATFDNFTITPLSPPAAGLPRGWTCGDAGAVAAPGSCEYEVDDEPSPDFVIRGSGADIWGTADEFSFARHAAFGDFSLTARVLFVENVHRWTKVGLMIRDWNGTGAAPAGARHASLFVTPTTERGTAFQRRPVQDGTSVHTAGPVTTAPLWLRLVRTGDQVRAYTRKEATDAWTLVGTQTFTGLPWELSAMLVVSSHVDGTLATARFDHVEVTELRPMQSADIGATTPGSTSTDGIHTVVSGNGADIWGTADAFRFHYHALWHGDGTIVARVRSLEHTHAWAKAGVMFRESLEPGSKHVMAIVSGSRGLAMQYRAATSGTSASTTAAPGSAPVWLALRRFGNRFSASWSVDGEIWHFLGETTIDMNLSLYVGLPVTSHAEGVTTTAVFDDVVIRR
ncbi:MAG TPA: SBBP repeat-containing protein [Vicinamibacterales bacterium]|nr:SBBP repeat-containing protein [Vicinamibacterales bacterium]